MSCLLTIIEDVATLLTAHIRNISPVNNWGDSVNLIVGFYFLFFPFVLKLRTQIYMSVAHVTIHVYNMSVLQGAVFLGHCKSWTLDFGMDNGMDLDWNMDCNFVQCYVLSTSAL